MKLRQKRWIPSSIALPAKKRRAVLTEEKIHATLVSSMVQKETRLEKKDVKSRSRLTSMGKRLIAISRLPTEDLSEDFIEFVRNMRIDEHEFDHKESRTESVTFRFILANKQMSPEISIHMNGFRFGDQNDLDIEQKETCFNIFLGEKAIFKSIDLYFCEVMVNPTQWSELATSCFGPNHSDGESRLFRLICSFLTNCDSIRECTRYSNGLRYSFFAEFWRKMEGNASEILDKLLPPDLKKMVFAYSHAFPFEEIGLLQFNRFPDRLYYPGNAKMYDTEDEQEMEDEEIIEA